MQAAEWQPLLAQLASSARENGGEAVNQTAAWIAEILRRAGLEPMLIAYDAHPYRLRIAGCIGLFGALVYAAAMLGRRPRWALLVTVALPVFLLAELDWYVPLFGWVGAQRQYHVETRIHAAQPTQHLMFVAHFDSKTDLLDHVERAPLELLGLPASVLMLVGAVAALRRRGELTRLSRSGVVIGVVYGAGLFLSISAGAFVRLRSDGALDDGSACAVLIRLAQKLEASPPAHTDVTILLVSSEESGVYGSWVYAEKTFRERPQLPTRVINLEFLGAAADLAVFGRETFTLRSYKPSTELLTALDAVHQEQRGKPLYRTWYGAATDARSFLAHGIPALTLVSDLPDHALARGMHSAADNLSRVDVAALDANLRFLEAAVRHIDSLSAP